MSDRDDLFERLSEGPENAEQVTVRTNRENGTVEVELERTVVELNPDEAHTFADDLENDARENGWYHAGQTRPFLENVRESADAVE